ncbi:hypothetical protein [Streptomyces chartreusis]|uniref:hypothetical protein n=1 Tax=Streptomyces chartreusis TaxID=1969 RepID=UPI0037DC54D2|nr:hypothetical protein OG938_48470 [Streptomyces chartreusis]
MTAKYTYPCPTGQKKRYAAREAADNAARRSQIGIAHPLYPYVCVCTWWHLSKQQPDTIPADAVAEPDDIYRLQIQSDAAFRETVATEARGKLPRHDRIALRQPGNLLRWTNALKELRADINIQLTERAGDKTLEAHDWRKRAEGYRDVLALRLQECRDLRARHLEKTQPQRDAAYAERQATRHEIQQAAAASNLSRRESRAQQTDRQLDSYGIPAHANKELRRQAGENAIKRLIDAHGIEFTRYLAEECAALGAPLPNRVRKHLPAADLAQTA